MAHLAGIENQRGLSGGKVDTAGCEDEPDVKEYDTTQKGWRYKFFGKQEETLPLIPRAAPSTRVALRGEELLNALAFGSKSADDLAKAHFIDATQR
jgi:hypothetical protein